MNKGKTVVEFKDVLKEYGEGDGKQIAVNHIDFTIDEGEFVVILGQSGAGKSTVLNMLGGMDKPTSGTVTVDGAIVSSMNDAKLSDYRAEKIGFIFQFYNLIPSLTAYENVALTKSIVKNALDPMEMLERVGLKKHAKKFPSQMSGGEQQRVSVLKLLVGMSHDYGNTVILVTHNADIAKCADKVIRMKNGKVREIKINESPVPVEEVEW